MAKIDYTITVHNEFETQTISITGETTNSGVIYESDMDSAVQAFASNLAAGTSGPPLTLDSVHKTTTTVTDTTL